MLHFSQIFRTEALTFMISSLQTLYYNTFWEINASKCIFIQNEDRLAEILPVTTSYAVYK